MNKKHQELQQPQQPLAIENTLLKPIKKPKEIKPKEIGGPKGPEPTRYGDWEKAGRCIDF